MLDVAGGSRRRHSDHDSARPFVPDTLGLETDMFIASVPGATDKRVFLVGVEGKRLIPSKQVLDELKRIGILDKGDVSSVTLTLFPTLPNP
jgi:hypothetical protein